MVRNFIPVLMVVFSMSCSTLNKQSVEQVRAYFETKEFRFEEVPGISKEEGYTRRDNSDIIKVNGKYYVYYTKITAKVAGYWGTVWGAVSEDEGHTWTELGEVLGKGEKGQWDSQAVFTPNIIKENGTYYLYYTGVRPTPTNPHGKFENNTVNDFTAIGVAKSHKPEGPFVRYSENPILTVSKDHSVFDSYRVDDAVLIKKEGKYWFYYKGRKYADGGKGPKQTQMGVAFADKPEGPFVKYENNPILPKSHEVFLWKQNDGIACLASISCTFEYSSDGIDFLSKPMALEIPPDERPYAAGAYRPDLTGEKASNKLTWGISMFRNKLPYLGRWELVDKKTD